MMSHRLRAAVAEETLPHSPFLQTLLHQKTSVATGLPLAAHDSRGAVAGTCCPHVTETNSELRARLLVYCCSPGDALSSHLQ